MSDYLPALLAQKWIGHMPALLNETREIWRKDRPRKRFFSVPAPEKDDKNDTMTTLSAKKALLLQGEIVWSMITRAFFPAYIPGRNTHYGSVVYSVESDGPDSIFRLAWAVNQLREPGIVNPPGTEKIATAINDDRSNFSRLRLPAELGVGGESYFANLCVHRSRLPGGYLHDRLLPLLIAPQFTEWCCILPLRFWAPPLCEIWRSGPPAYEPEVFADQLARYKVIP